MLSVWVGFPWRFSWLHLPALLQTTRAKFGAGYLFILTKSQRFLWTKFNCEMNVISPSRNPHNVTRDFLPTIYETLYNFNASNQFLLSLCFYKHIDTLSLVDIFKESSGFVYFLKRQDNFLFWSLLIQYHYTVFIQSIISSIIDSTKTKYLFFITIINEIASMDWERWGNKKMLLKKQRKSRPKFLWWPQINNNGNHYWVK